MSLPWAICADAGGQRRRGPARGAARGVAARPGIQRAAVQVVLGEPAKREARGVGAAHRDGAGAAQVGHHRAVGRRDQVTPGDHAMGGRSAGKVDIDLDGDRHAVQRAERFAGRHGAIGRPGLRQRRLGEHIDHRVDRGIDGGDPIEAGLHRLAAADQPGADAVGEIDRVPGMQGRDGGGRLGHGGSPERVGTSVPDAAPAGRWAPSAMIRGYCAGAPA